MTPAALKVSHLARLASAAATPDLPRFILNRIDRMRRKIEACDPEIHAGMLGPNGHGPAVDDVCRDAAGWAHTQQLLDTALYGRADAADVAASVRRAA